MVQRATVFAEQIKSDLAENTELSTYSSPHAMNDKHSKLYFITTIVFNFFERI